MPGNAGILFTAHTIPFDFDHATIEVVTLPDRRRLKLVENGSFGRYLPGHDGRGYLLYVSRGVLYASPFRLSDLKPSGAAFPILEHLAHTSSLGVASVDVSANGTAVYRADAGSGRYWLERGEHRQFALPGVADGAGFSLSADGRRLAAIEGGMVVVHDLLGKTRQVLTSSGAAVSPVWSSDERYVLYATTKGIFFVDAGGGRPPRLLLDDAQLRIPHSVTRDGKWLIGQLLRRGAGQVWDIFAVPLSHDENGLRAGAILHYLETGDDERLPDFSPDGRWVAYASSKSGEFQVYVRAFPDGGREWPISNGGGLSPKWSADGKQIFYVNANDQLVTARVQIDGGSLTVQSSEVWSSAHLPRVPLNYTIDAKSGRVLALLYGDATGRPETHVNILFNMLAEIRRLGAPGK